MLFLAACGRVDAPAPVSADKPLAEVAGEVIGTGLDGSTIKLGEGELAGKAVILNYFHST